MADERKPRSASTWIGCGCASVVAVFMLLVVAFSLMTYQAGKNLEAMTADPERAAEAIREVLPYDALPEGYRPVGTLKVPFMMSVVFFGGPGAGEEPDAWRHGFFMVRIRDWFGRGERSADWLSGADVELQPIEQQEFSFEPKEPIGRGELTVQGAGVVWLARRGLVRVAAIGQEGEEEETSVEAAEPQAVVFTMTSIDCDDGWQRIGLWFEPDPSPETAAAEMDWSGTPADPAAIAPFLDRFGLCG